jgi:hypothetical protein
MLAVGGHRGGDGRPTRHELRDALRWLGAPPTLFALGVLALNDHVLKHATPGLVTGKLSDVAGMLVAPPLLAVGLALVRAARPAPAALVATAAGFVLVKTFDWGVDAANTVWSLVWPTEILRDPTDLVALPGLLLAALVARTERRREPGVRRRAGLALGSLVLPFAVVATAATSPCYTAPGLEDVGVVRGDWSGPPAGAENRLVVAMSYRNVSIDVVGRLRRLSAVDDARVADLGPRLERACSVTERRRCWRGAPRTKEPWVETTTDGGATWSTDYRMSARDLGQVREAAGETCDDEPLPVAPRDLAVLDTPDGPLVVVASGRAGLLLRQPDGTWSHLDDDQVAREAGTPPTADPDVLFTPLDPTPTPTTSSRTQPSASPGPPTRPAQPTPCATRTVVTVTPDPRNGTPFPRELCLG